MFPLAVYPTHTYTPQQQTVKPCEYQGISSIETQEFVCLVRSLPRLMGIVRMRLKNNKSFMQQVHSMQTLYQDYPLLFVSTDLNINNVNWEETTILLGDLL